MFPYQEHLKDIAERDAMALNLAAVSYGDSWLRRGGVGAYMVAIRKGDRLETLMKKCGDDAVLKIMLEKIDTRLEQHGYNLFTALKADQRPEGLIDDIRDLRRYLMLWEAEALARGICPGGLKKDERR